ncbi:hypothetical protein EDD18DRAFT_1428674 [Armillaria luteobubalina]|uniref:Uncharacterized protein n=1 Tax=Armillaria luteobubalina TaxID=153913 RepID=A0AA39PJB5_9AGAR|nr:hypothetical protein EDD18DRAFT_1428674 [Armillaria luteobubalina]
MLEMISASSPARGTTIRRLRAKILPHGGTDLWDKSDLAPDCHHPVFSHGLSPGGELAMSDTGTPPAHIPPHKRTHHVSRTSRVPQSPPKSSKTQRTTDLSTPRPRVANDNPPMRRIRSSRSRSPPRSSLQRRGSHYSERPMAPSDSDDPFSAQEIHSNQARQSTCDTRGASSNPAFSETTGGETTDGYEDMTDEDDAMSMLTPAEAKEQQVNTLKDTFRGAMKDMMVLAQRIHTECTTAESRKFMLEETDNIKQFLFVTTGQNWKSIEGSLQDTKQQLEATVTECTALKEQVAELSRASNAKFERMEQMLDTLLRSNTTTRTAEPSPARPNPTANNTMPAQQTSHKTKKIPANANAAHHPTRLVVQILPSGIPADERKEPFALVKTINEALQDHDDAKHMVVVSGKYNTNGNVIICTREDQTAVELAKFSHLFTDLIAPGRDVTCRPDRRWFKIQVNNVRTGAFDSMYGTPRVHSSKEILEEFCRSNPLFKTLDLLQEPRWMRTAEEIINQAHSSVVFAIGDEDQARFLLKERKYLAAFGRTAPMKPYADHSPVIQSVEHSSEEHQKNCQECAKWQETHMEEDEAATTAVCAHNLKCVNCGGDHAVDARRCPECTNRYGTARAEASKKTVKKKKTKRSKVGPSHTTSVPPNTHSNHCCK